MKEKGKVMTPSRGLARWSITGTFLFNPAWNQSWVDDPELVIESPTERDQLSGEGKHHVIFMGYEKKKKGHQLLYPVGDNQ